MARARSASGALQKPRLKKLLGFAEHSYLSNLSEPILREKNSMFESEQKRSKKIYFIKRAKPGHELTTLLKNKFKSVDAIRDIFEWFHENRNFHVVLTEWDDEYEDDSAKTIAISPFLPPYVNHRNITHAINRIIAWLDAGRDFDITLNPTDPFLVNLN